MTFVEFIVLLILIGIVYICIHKNEWKSDNRITPPGYKTDWNKATSDIMKHGKEYYYQQNLKGKYDIPDKK